MTVNRLLAASSLAASLLLTGAASAQSAPDPHAAHSPAQHAAMMATSPAPVVSRELKAAIDQPTRKDDRARDQFRHPGETLAFFGVTPTMKVGEYAPGGGWYSRLLGHYLGAKGQLVGLFFNPGSGPFDAKAQQGIRDGAVKFPAEVAGFTGAPADHVSAFTLDAVPEGQAGTFDRILVIRMMHNLMRWNIADSEMKAMRALLKDDGMIGIVQHRAKAAAPFEYANGSKGYLRETDVVKFMELNGFQLVGASEVNANPADSADHPKGVWEMPPSLSTKREDLRTKGESDRMTLLFRKRP